MNNLDQLGGELFEEIVNPAVLILSSLAFIWFLFGVMNFLRAFYWKNDPKELETGKQHMLYGLLGLFIIYSASAIFTFLYDLFTVNYK